MLSFAQDKRDTAANNGGIKNNNIFKLVMNAVSRGQADTVVKAIKSQEQFLPYQGKGIRNIYVRRFGFEKVFTDTSRRLITFGAALLNDMHRESRDWVIRNHLFIKEGTPLDAYKVADNERYLRSLSFIQDARIELYEIPGKPDSIDIVVITKDLFSINGEIDGASNTNFKVGASESNFLGWAQTIGGTALFDVTRFPSFGYQLLYAKNGIGNSFANATASYTTINSDLASGAPDETAWTLRINRPLVSEFMHFAGGITVGKNESFNTYGQADSLFYKYSYTTFDVWGGYALDANRYSYKNPIRNRKFLSFRYFQNKFADIPYQVGENYNFKFNDRQAFLGQLTFFKQDFLKTNYIYGFGTTEDVPHGYNLSITSGWYKQVTLNRFYTGVEVNRYIATTESDFFQYFIRAGGFFYRNQLQDASILTGASIFSRLFFIGDLKLRQYANFSYTRLFNDLGLDYLTIDNVFGLRYFSSDSTLGQQRISLHEETFVFMKYKLLGFKFAPFVFADATFLTPPGQNFYKSDAYYGIGGGVRTRNENLVFGTMELRFVYFPRNVPLNNSFKILTTVNLLFKYNATYVRPPDIVQLNNDPGNSVYSVY